MKPRIPAVTVVGIVSGEDVEERINGKVIDVARTGRVDLQASAVGSHPHHAAAVMRDGRAILSFRLHIAIVTDGDVDPAVDPQGDPVGAMIGPPEVQSEPETLHQIIGHIGDAITSGVAIRRERRRMHDIERPAVVRHASRRIHLGEHRKSIRRAVAVVVDESHHPPFALVGREREVGIDADEHHPLNARSETGRVHRHRWSGEERGREARRCLDLIEQRPLSRRVMGNRAALRDTLGGCG